MVEEVQSLKNQFSAKENVLNHIKTTYLNPQNYFDLTTKEVIDKSNSNSLKQICIITEDRGNGYQFILSYILQNYPEMSGIVIGAVGKDSFRYILEEYSNYDAYIFVIDRGISEKEWKKLKSAFHQFKANNKNNQMYIYSPNCLEEILLSFYKLKQYINLNNDMDALNLHTELEQIIQGTIKDIDYNKYKTLDIETIEKVCERLILKLTDGTPFKCQHSQKEIKGKQPYLPAYMSPCWRCICCNVKDYDTIGYVNINDCKHPNIDGNKLDYIARHSLLYGLTYIIHKIYGSYFLDKWNKMDADYFNRLVKEL